MRDEKQFNGKKKKADGGKSEKKTRWQLRS